MIHDWTKSYILVNISNNVIVQSPVWTLKVTWGAFKTSNARTPLQKLLMELPGVGLDH